MHWLRKPRLNSAVATVAVEMVLSLLRVASLSLVMRFFQVLVIPGHAPWRGPGMTSINRRLLHRRAKTGFEEVEVAALVGLLDVPREHPAIAALEPGLRLLPCGPAFGKLRFGHIEIDAACRDVERDAVAVLHQRQRAADIGFRRDVQDAGAV